MPPKKRSNPEVDAALAEEDKWKPAFTKLRKLALGFPELTEERKWGKPCYSYEGRNVFLIHGFKDYCALLFMKGALLDDPEGILVQQTANVQAARQIRFTHAKEIDPLTPALKRYIAQAIDREKSGVKVEYKQTEDFAMPPEFKARLASDPALNKAFAALTPGRQRGYLLYFGGAKQAKTRAERIEKYVRHIFNGKGLQDD